MRPTIPRRAFLASAGVLPFVAPLQALLEGTRQGLRADISPGYGPLAPVKDAATGLPLLELPEGFRYVTFGWSLDAMATGARVPPSHDGMAAFPGPDGTVVLIRNHELGRGPAFGDQPYDPEAGGGTTTVVFDPRTERATAARPSLSGTLQNCAGGPTPWGTWLSCEESVHGPQTDPRLTAQHGYVFEVPTTGTAAPVPLKAMGCFVHEAAAIDPATGIVYLTEDQSVAGLYRFIPKTRDRLADGGVLQMLAVAGRPRYDTSRSQRVGGVVSVHWVDIDDPDRPHANPKADDRRGVYEQGVQRGGARFSRLEGACFADGRLFVTATDGGDARMGQVWELDPKESTLRLIYESPGPELLNMPDNLCLSPRGGLALCEDGTVRPCIHSLTRDGRIVRFARNNALLAGEYNGITGDFTTSEFAGATYSPDGQWLFVNMQRPGITLAITGPWVDGGL